ncbi:hypothetical protein [Chryseobacterium sp. ISL-6]|uniref:hypothetical protein n=1 Tax=Chryseobacterium sp. ISL-6 TaxID=2819143 RepID=UPI001BE55C30|nr:hypothetical protein [Chryseobacterium sp. ISL-6]MBT2623584.1 hypothetical protein [Chryseobacterium sp. ISL-6]
MGTNKNESTTPEIDKNIKELQTKREQEKEDAFERLIIEIIVSSTLKEYYETCNKIFKVQPNGTE